jgi:hypothetical protein
MRANQLRLWFASMAYVLLCALRRIALEHTQLAKATCGTGQALSLSDVGVDGSWRPSCRCRRLSSRGQLRSRPAP